jgi:hypothetical protein
MGMFKFDKEKLEEQASRIVQKFDIILPIWKERSIPSNQSWVTPCIRPIKMAAQPKPS